MDNVEIQEPGDLPVLKKSSAKYIVIYQAISLPIIVYIIHSEQYRSGPCTPNLDSAAHMREWLVTVILFIISIERSLSGSKAYLLGVLTGLSVMGVLFELSKYARLMFCPACLHNQF